jgi:hypothetical protein
VIPSAARSFSAGWRPLEDNRSSAGCNDVFRVFLSSDATPDTDDTELCLISFFFSGVRSLCLATAACRLLSSDDVPWPVTWGSVILVHIRRLVFSSFSHRMGKQLKNVFCLLLFPPPPPSDYFLRRRCNVIDRIGALWIIPTNSIDFPTLGRPN